MDADKTETVADEGVCAPQRESVRAALDRVLAAAPFRHAPQLAAFLKYVVEATLAGASERIKGYTIATEALGRDASFDPASDPIVRVEAGRLRRALARYYADVGRDDGIVIELARGSYVPTFRRRTPALGRGTIPASARRYIYGAARRRLQLVATVAVVAAVVSAVVHFALAVWWRTSEPQLTGTIGSSPGARTTQSTDDPFPVVYVEPFDVSGKPSTSPVSTVNLRNRLRDALVPFDEIIVVTDPLPNLALQGTTVRSGGRAAHIDYRISGLIEYNEDGTLSPTFRLIDTADGTVVWTRTFDRIAVDAKPDDIEERIVRNPVATLAQPNGVIQARERSRRAAGAAIDPRYSCLLDNYEYSRSYDPAAHERVKACLTESVIADPNSAVGYAALARVYLVEYHFGFGSPPNDQSGLDRSLRMAQRAVDVRPHSARAHHALMAAHFARREFAAALMEGEMAVALNPYDALIQADYASRLIRLGQIEKGTALLQQAARVGPIRLTRVEFYLFASAFLRGDLDTAAIHANAISTDAYPRAYLARALVAAKAGDMTQAQQAIGRLLALQPAWRVNPRRELEKVFPATEVADRFAKDLAAAGLDATN